MSIKEKQKKKLNLRNCDANIFKQNYFRHHFSNCDIQNPFTEKFTDSLERLKKKKKKLSQMTNMFYVNTEQLITIMFYILWMKM
jgi:hypothetical protein